MTTKVEMLAEAKKRGILSPEEVAMFDEAQRRGLFDAPEEVTQIEQTETKTPYKRVSIEDIGEMSMEEMQRSFREGGGGELIRNVPGSTGEFAKGLYNIVRHPIETAKGAGKLALGAGAKAIPGEQPFEEYANAFGQMYKERYGKDWRETLIKDPVGVMADFAGFLTMGGAALRGAGTLGKVAKIPQAGKLTQAGKAVQQVGASMEPLNVAKKVVKPITKAIPKKLPPNLYKQSAKFSSALPETKRDELARLAVEKGIMPTAKGIDKANKFLDEFDSRIESLIKQIDKKGKKANKKVLFMHLKELRKELGGVDLKGKSNLKIINAVAKQFDEHLKTSPYIKDKKWLSAADLQNFKKKAYLAVRYDRKRGSMTLPAERTAKEMARAAKEKLEQMHPEIKGVNKDYGPMIELTDAIEKRAAVIEGSQLVSFDVPVKAAAGGALLGTTGKVAGATVGILDKPHVKAKVAILLESLRKYKGKASIAGATARSVAREGERAEPTVKKAKIGNKKVGKYTVSEINKIKKSYPKAKRAKDGYYYVTIDGVKNRITF